MRHPRHHDHSARGAGSHSAGDKRQPQQSSRPQVAGEAGSNLALGVKGAERLLGKGHLAARLNGDKPSGEEYFVAQVPFAETDDLAMYADAAVEAWR